MAVQVFTIVIFFPDIFDQLKPSLVSPVVGWLCHETCEDTGAVIEAAGGWVGKCKYLNTLRGNYK